MKKLHVDVYRFTIGANQKLDEVSGFKRVQRQEYIKLSWNAVHVHADKPRKATSHMCVQHASSVLEGVCKYKFNPVLMYKIATKISITMYQL